MNRQQVYNSARKILESMGPENPDYQVIEQLLQMCKNDNNRVRLQSLTIERLQKNIDSQKLEWEDYSSVAEAQVSKLLVVRWRREKGKVANEYAVGYYSGYNAKWVFPVDIPDDLEKQWINIPAR